VNLRFGFSFVVLLAGLVSAAHWASAQATPPAQAIPGSAVDPRLLGKWETILPTPGNPREIVTEITTAPDAFAALRQAWSLPPSWPAQANDAVILNENGQVSGQPVPGLVRCLNLPDGAILLVQYTRAGPNQFLVGVPTQFRPDQASPSLVEDNFAGRPIVRSTKLPPAAAMEPSDHSPGALVDPALLGKWMWTRSGDQLPQSVDISTSADAYQQFATQNAPSLLGPSWQAPANVAVFKNSSDNYISILQTYTLADGTKLAWIWGTELLCCSYVKKSDGIELTTLGLLAGETSRLRPLTPDERQTAEATDKAQAQADGDAAVTANLNRIALAARQYLDAKNTSEVSVAQLLAAGADSNLAPLVSVYGEKYDDIVVHQGDNAISVSLPDGRIITCKE